MEPRARKPLLGMEVAFTGRLASLTRREAALLVRDLGGTFSRTVGRRTSLLVIGEEGWPLRSDGRLTRKLLLARAIQAGGGRIEIAAEEEFLERAGLSGRRAEVRRLHTAAALGRLLGVSRERLRSWMRAGLLRPALTVHRLAYFEFRGVAAAAALDRLVRSGVDPARLRRSLLQLREWRDDVHQAIGQLERRGEGPVLVRLDDGRLAEPSGQLLFDFVAAAEEEGSGAQVISLHPRDAEAWFDLALRREEEGRLEEAAEAYREALLLEGRRPEPCFNLGNVLYRLGRKADAAERFSRAVELDPEYAEAWNNLGNALADLGRLERAVEAYRRALSAVPDYADAHYNLAEALEEMGRRDEARPHWRAYLERDPRGPWADIARRKMGT